jgi:calcineurin-like phosphoesterase family protein
MKRIIMFVLLFAALKVAGQTTGYLRFDTVKIMKQNGYCELYIINKTKDSLGLLTNVGGGLTQFKRARAINDSLIIIGNDTIRVRGGAMGLTLQQVTDNGQKTTDTIIAEALRTKHILPDTLLDGDYEIEVFPDLQGMTSGFPDQLYSMFDWVRDNKTSKNIKALLTVGDLTDANTIPEWVRVDSMFKKIDSIDIPYIAVVGNHDYMGGGYGIAGARSVLNFDTYFGVSRYASKTWKGNAFHDSADNYYIKFDVGREKYLVLGLEFIPTDSALDWGARVVDSFPDRKVIICTHAYITTFGERSTDSSVYSGVSYNLISDNSGQEMWEKFVRKHKNILMVLNGHFIDVAHQNQGYSKRISNVGDSGNIVHQIFVNYQRDGNATYINPTGSGNAGMGYFMRLRFSPSKSKVYVAYYSSFLNQFDSRIDSFSLSNPVVEVQSSLTVSDGLYVRGETVLDSNVYIAKLSKNNVLISAANSRIDTIPNVSSTASFLASNGLTSPARFRTLTSSDIPSGSNYYIQNQISSTQTGSFWINGTGVVSTIGTYPSSGLQGGAGGNFNVVHAGGSNGLVITRATADANGANLNFYKTNNADASVRTAVTAGTIIGSIRFQAVANDNLPYLGSLINGTADSVGASSIYGGLRFSTGVFLERMRINHYGKVGIGTTAQNAYLPDLLNVYGTTRITDTLKTPNILTQYDTTNFKPVVTDVNGNYFKMIGWPITIQDSGIWKNNVTMDGNHTMTTAGNTWTISSNGNTPLSLSNTGSGLGLFVNTFSGTGAGMTVQSNNATALQATSFGSGFGASINSSSNVGAYIGTTSGIAGAAIEVNPSSTNTSISTVQLKRYTSGTAANGIAGGIEFITEPASGTVDVTSGYIYSKWTDATFASRTSSMEFHTTNSTTTARRANIAGSGQWTWDNYGAGTFTGTPATTPVYTSTGAIVERVAPKIYTALLSQSGTSDPTVIVLGTNEIGTIVWTRNSTGNYTGTLTGAFTADKTWAICQKGDMSGSFVNGLLSRGGANTVTLDVRDNTATLTDNFTNMSIEIRVYP